MLSPKNKSHVEGYLYLAEDKTKYYPGDGTKKSFMVAKIKVPRFGTGKDGKKVYDWFKFKAFGTNADFIHNHCANNEPVTMDCELQVEENTLNDDGTVKYYGQPILVIDVVEKCLRTYSENGANAAAPMVQAPAAAAPAAVVPPQATFGQAPVGSFVPPTGGFQGYSNPAFNPANLQKAAGM